MLLYRLSSIVYRPLLSRGVEKWQPGDAGVERPTEAIDIQVDRHNAAGRGIARLKMAERDILLHRRRPDPAGSVANLPAVDIQRDHRAPGCEWIGHRQTEGVVLALELDMVDLQTHQHSRRAALLFGQQRLAPDERAFVPA